MNQLTPVAVVGGGPCGLLTALLLARAGVKCTLFEKKEGLSDHPKAMGTSRRTAEIYRQIGLYAAFQAVGLPLEGKSLAVWSRTLAGEELGRVPLTDFHSPLTPVTAQHCPQTETERILLDAVRQEPLAEIHFGREVERARVDEGGGEIRLTSGETCIFEWLVVADGAGSRLRKQFGIGTTGPGDMGHFLNVMFRAPYGEFLKERPALLYNCFWDGGFEGFVSINGYDHWLMHHFLEAGQPPESFSREDLERLVRSASGRSEIPVEILAVTPWVMSPKLAQNFRNGRAFLIGDAAARLSPAGGLGLNNGLQGVHNLAWKLAAVIHGKASESLLDTYNMERNALSSFIMRTSNQNAGEIFATVSEAIAGNWGEVRRLVAANHRGGSGLGLDLGFTYEKGAFVPDGTEVPTPEDPVNEFLPTAHPGRRAPHLPVTTENHETSLLDFFTGDFVLLAGKAGETWSNGENGIPVRRHGRDFHAPGFEDTYGIEDDGAVLIRPDGVVGARWPHAPGDAAAVARDAWQRILK